MGEPAAVDERVIDLTAVEARQGGWLPVPVPPPTYTLKAKAPRPAPPPLEEEPVAEPVAAWAQPSEPEDAGRPLDLDEVLARRRAVNG